MIFFIPPSNWGPTVGDFIDACQYLWFRIFLYSCCIFMIFFSLSIICEIAFGWPGPFDLIHITINWIKNLF